MAVTFKGSAVSWPINGNDKLTQNLFVIENGHASRVNVILRRLTVQNDAVVILTTVMPLVKVFLITATPSGGIFLSKCPFDTNHSSDDAVRIRAAISSGTPITVDETFPFWQQFTTRLHSAAEQQSAWDNNLLPWLVGNQGNDFILRPGQSLLVQVRGAVVTSNPSATNNWFVQCVWEEDSLGTFNISGVVTLNSAPVEGAKVIVMEAKDQLMTDPVLVEIKTTNAQGQWSSTIRKGCVGAAFAQHKDGDDFYTAPGSPFLEE